MAVATEPPTGIILRSPAAHKPSETSAFAPPALEWLYRTWSVTHSTLDMWRSSKNVRITYGSHLPKSSNPPLERVTDLVEYEPIDGKKGLRNVKGIDTAARAGDASVWTWRGSRWLKFVTSEWELLGWGQTTLPDGSTERWIVTWFAATSFTKEGVDVLCDRREGLSNETALGVIAVLEALEAKPVAELCKKSLRPVAIVLPWLERGQKPEKKEKKKTDEGGGK